MTDYPTIRIKCDPADMILAVRAAEHGMTHCDVGQDTILSFNGYSNVPAFYVKRTKTGVTVRQIEGKAV